MCGFMPGLCIALAGITCGLCMDYAWIMHGLHFENVLISIPPKIHNSIFGNGLRARSARKSSQTYHEPITIWSSRCADRFSVSKAVECLEWTLVVVRARVCLRGLCVDHAWIMHGLCMDHAWIMHGSLCMDHDWVTYGSCVDSCLDYALLLLALRVDYLWIMRGLCMDCTSKMCL